MSNRVNDSDLCVSQAVERAVAMLAEGKSAVEALSVLVRASEAVAGGGSVSSILVLDGDGLLRNGASPGLPEDYVAAIDGLRPDPMVGTCAAAAATGQVVVSPDFRADNKWGELKHHPLALGFLGAWSMPIKRECGAVLGTFGTYFRDRREPTVRERAAVERLARAAAQAIEFFWHSRIRRACG